MRYTLNINFEKTVVMLPEILKKIIENYCHILICMGFRIQIDSGKLNLVDGIFECLIFS